MNPFYFFDKLFSKRIIFSPEEEKEAARKKREDELNIPQKNIRIASTAVIMIAVYTILIIVLDVYKPKPAFVVRYIISLFEIIFLSKSLWYFLRERTSTNKFYNVPAQKVTIITLTLHFVFNFIVILIMPLFYTKYWIIIDAILLGCAMLIRLMSDTNSEAIKQQEKIQKKDTAPMKKFLFTTFRLPCLTKDPELRKALDRLREEVQYSDPVGTLETEQAEEDISLRLSNLETMLNNYAATPSEDIKKVILSQCEEIQDELDQRNIQCIKSR